MLEYAAVMTQRFGFLVTSSSVHENIAACSKFLFGQECTPYFSEIKSKMKYFKVLLPFLAISNGQEDGEEEDRQCVNCEQASVLIVGGQAANGNNYEAVGNGVLNCFYT